MAKRHDASRTKSGSDNERNGNRASKKNQKQRAVRKSLQTDSGLSQSVAQSGVARLPGIARRSQRQPRLNTRADAGGNRSAEAGSRADSPGVVSRSPVGGRGQATHLRDGRGKGLLSGRSNLRGGRGRHLGGVGASAGAKGNPSPQLARVERLPNPHPSRSAGASGQTNPRKQPKASRGLAHRRNSRPLVVGEFSTADVARASGLSVSRVRHAIRFGPLSAYLRQGRFVVQAPWLAQWLAGGAR